MFFAYRSFYTQAPLCTGACRQQLAHRDAFAQRKPYLQKRSADRRFYIWILIYIPVCLFVQRFLRTSAFTHTHVPLDTHTHLCVYRQKLLHTGASAQKLLHTEAITHRCYFTHQLLRFACAHKRFNRPKTLIHTCVLTHRSDDTACAHSRLYTQKVPTQVPHMRIAHVPHDFEDRRCWRARGAHSVK